MEREGRDDTNVNKFLEDYKLTEFVSYYSGNSNLVPLEINNN